jgi:pSer/pThr/pTyr-binding forkhead associated (FHA) protein/tetratricopeptide (TPR) repeat protein
MTLLKLYIDGIEKTQLSLEEGREYIVGRSETCDLVLDPLPGISRQHLRISFRDRWVVEVLSKFGELYLDGQKKSEIHLQNGVRFSVPPFEFEFVDQTQPAMAVNEQPVEAAGGVFNDEHTFVGSSNIVAYLSVFDENRRLIQIFKLEGGSWLAGRETSNSLFIDNPRFSRKHFEIRKESGAHLIRDLRSSNGTRLNGIPLTEEWSLLQSGDRIEVSDWSIVFEIRDELFDQKWAEVKDFVRAPVVFDSGPQDWPTRGPEYSAAHEPYMEPAVQKKNPQTIRLLIAVLIIGGGWMYFSDPNSGKGEPDQKRSAAASSSPFEKLSPEQQQYVKDSYRLAESLFKQGRYELARQEISKIHQLVPMYMESKTLEQLADVAIQTQIDQQKAEAREKDQRQLETTILEQVEKCRPLLRQQVTPSRMDDCLSSVIALNPSHPEIMNLRAQAEELHSQRLIARERASDYRAQVRRRDALFGRAQDLLAKGDTEGAIRVFQSVISSSLADPKNLRAEARRQIASIQQNKVESQAVLQKQADEAYQRGDLKSAFNALKQAQRINPDNEVVRGRMTSILRDLRKQMQAYYQEAILEESVGEVDSAKAKWKKIIETSVPEEEYFKKSTIKLKKYGTSID